MTKKKNVLASFLSMLCLGGIYAWSVFVPSLKTDYGLSGAQTQLIFGFIIAVFALSMIWAGSLERKIGAKKVAIISAILFFSGYGLAGISSGNFFIILAGIGIFSGIATGFGYLMALTIPVKWFPEKKGLIAGIAAAGFGGGAVVVTLIAESLFSAGFNALNIFMFIGVGFGIVLMVMAMFYSDPVKKTTAVPLKPGFLKDRDYLLLLGTIFCGTFSGLMVIGNLKPMGLMHGLSEQLLALTIILFSLANFTGRIVWGWLSDLFSNKLLVLLALGLLGISTLLLGFLPQTGLLFVFLALIAGFTFGSNFVLFTKETAQLFGVSNVGKVYPWVFLGYGIAGITGPLVGGWLSDIFGNYQYAALIAAIISIGGGLTYFFLLKENPDQPAA
jgi:MFS transporter, OFA family, oxalate/formate antiporter